MTRPDPYTPVHKMQRARLFELTVAAGTIDSANGAARNALAGALDALVVEISEHGDHEERFVHPLLRKHAPDLAAELDAAHDVLDEQLEALGRRAGRFAADAPEDPNDLHRALAAFTSTYLVHLDREETAALPALWSCCTDDELRTTFTAFRASRSATTNLASVFALAPTLNPQELTRTIVDGLGTVAPHEVTDLLATVLAPLQLGALRHAVLAPVP